MLGRLARWLGEWAIVALTAWLAWEQVKDHLPPWSLYAIVGAVAVCALLALPVSQNADGSTRHLINSARGRSSPAVTASEDGSVSGNVFASGRATVHQHGLTPQQLDGLTDRVDRQVAVEVDRKVHGQMQVFKGEFAKLYGDAYGLGIDRAQSFMVTLVETMAAKAPGNLSAIGTIDMQAAILNAQTSAALHGDEELSGTLVDVLVDKSGAQPRSLKGVVLTEAVLVAGKLTTEHINLLTAILILTRTLRTDLTTHDAVFNFLEAECRPLFNRIPSDDSTTQYLSYTGVGREDGLGSPELMRDRIITGYDAVFTVGFPVTSIPDNLKKFQDLFADVPSIYGALTANQRVDASSSQALTMEILGDSHKLLPFQDQIIELIKNKPLSNSKFSELLEASYPDLAQFLYALDKLSAQKFLLSSVGCALGQANWRRLRPDTAPEVAIYLT